MYYWAPEEDSFRQLSYELKTSSEHTIVDWRNFCRDICAIHYGHNPQKIGDVFLCFVITEKLNCLGASHTVEIDESCFAKGKYQRGRLLNTK